MVSGPNYGRNTTAVFALSSGTLGGALEASVCGVRSIALSYAFFDRNHDASIIAAASRASVSVIEKLAKGWDKEVGLYSVNVPLIEGVEGAKVLWTKMLLNRWSSGSCFEEVVSKGSEGPEEAEAEIRRGESMSGERPVVNGGKAATGSAVEESKEVEHSRYEHKHFTWAPKFKDVYESVEKAGPGNDGWTVKEGMISVTPLKASFMQVEGYEGEMKL